MDAVMFVKEWARMCKTAKRCDNCSIGKNASIFTICGNAVKEDPEKAVSIIEKWSDEHPVKTRQSEFLKMCPYCGSNNLEIFTIERNDSSKYKWKAYAICSECFGSAVNHGLDLTENEAKDNAIKAWNRRAGKQNEQS